VKLAIILIAITSGPTTTGCAKPSYLGATVPKPCTSRDAEACLGWMAERDLVAAELDIYDDSTLRKYVQSVANRVARRSLLGTPPRVIIADRDETYATSGRRIVIARRTLEKLSSEAELAAVLAHELAHVEGRHGIVSLFGRPPDEGFVNRRDAEAVADERAVWLLERAGYAPTAMASALKVVLEAEDEEHPLRADRIARVTVLAGGRDGFHGREELLGRLANMVVGRDPRLGRRTDSAWVVSALGIALELGDADQIRADQDVLALRRDRATLIAYAVGAPWGRELSALVEDREVAKSEIGDVVMGTLPYSTRRDDTPLGKLAHAVRNTLPQPAPGSRVAIVIRDKGALVIEIGGRSVPALLLRNATPGEVAASEPVRRSAARR
jgi:predicted Zn-dependent protease